MPTRRAVVGSFESRSLWATRNIPADAEPGLHQLTVRLGPKENAQAVDLRVTVDVSPL
jgi:hypothetical protein